MTAPEKTQTRGQRALVIAFFVLLWLPLADSLLGIDHTRATDENRALAKPPLLAPTLHAAREFPRAFEAWYNDHFGFRTFLVRQYHTVKTGWMGIADRELAIIGHDGWLYLGRQRLIDETRGLNPASPSDIARWAEELDGIRQWQETRGGKFLVVTIPDKHRVFPEHLPDWFVPSEHRRKEQLKAALANSGVELLDLTDTLRAAKASSPEPIWLKTDTHWSGVGAYYAYQAIMERLGISPLERGALVASSTAPHYDGGWHNTGNLARFIGMGDLMPETWVGLLPEHPRAVPTQDFPPPTKEPGDVNVPFATRISDPDLPRALVIGDSFRWALIPLLSENFRFVLYTDFRYCFFDPALAEAIEPDVTLFLMTERQLLHMPVPPEENTW